jgi:hypothetical protein
VNIEHHHRRIHWKTKAIRWGLIPLVLAAVPAWLYVSYGTCQEEGDELGTLCHAFRVIPFLPMIAAVAIFAFIVWDLMKLGHETGRGKKTATPQLHHARHGYEAVSDAHRRHIHMALLLLGVVTLAVALGIGWEAYKSTH